MKQKKKIGRRVLAALLLTATVIGILGMITVTAGAAQVTRIEKKYDIAVVFDNSGSMYGNQAWCRAKYAMEIFASMLNYDKDRLRIFPMWEVTTDGSQPDSGGSYAAIEINNKADIDKISNLYTVHPSNTPFAPISEAYDYLKGSAADEKWLIILTDGAFNQDARGKSASFDLQKRVAALASQQIKVQYLGFGGATKLRSNEAGNFFAKKSTDTSLKDDLVGICNSIFQRSLLPQSRIQGEQVKLDLSMRSVIVFAQGANATVTSLKDSNGNEIAVTMDSGQRKFSTIKAKGYSDAPVDSSLAGQVVTFGACPKGEYTLTYTGAEQIQIFYEPDVDIDISFVNSDGERIDNPDDFVAGEYTVTSRIVDATTGEDVTSHELMGNSVQLKTYVKTTKDTNRREFPNGSKILFEPDTAEIWIEGEYLGAYKISSKDDSKWKWLDGLEILPDARALKLTLSAEQDWYILKKESEWKPIRASLTLDGQPLTEEQIRETTLTVTLTDGQTCRIEPLPGESAFLIYFWQDANGRAIETPRGKHKLKAEAAYTDEFGEISKSGTKEISFTVEPYPSYVPIIGWALLALLVLLFIIWLLKHKVLPSAVYVNLPNNGRNLIRPRKKQYELSTPIYSGEVTCIAEPSTPWASRKATSASFIAKSILVSSDVISFTLGNQTFNKGNGKYVNSRGKTVEEVRPQVRNNITLAWATQHRSVSAKILINPRRK